jgi:hypothetical protein
LSYDVYLQTKPCKCGEYQGGDILYSANMTSNVAGMWNAAGAPLREWAYDKAHGPASELACKLGDAISNMEREPPRYRAMEPGNGWGTYEHCLEFLKKLRAACLRHPDAVVYVSN